MPRSIAATAALLILLPATAPAGAWLQKPGGWYLKVLSSYLYTEEEYNGAGELTAIGSAAPGVSNGSFEDIALTAYIEYGVTDKVTFVGSLPYKYLTSTWTEVNGTAQVQRDIVASSGGMTDLRAGARYPLKRDGFPISVQGIVKLPLGYDPTPDIEQVPPLGSGQVDVAVALLAGASLWPFPGYVSGFGGYRFRGGLADEVFFNLETGAGVWRLFGKIALDAVYSTEEPADLGTTSTLTVNNEDLLKLVGELNYSISDHVALSAEAFHTLAGRNTVAGTTWVAGLIYRH